MITSIAYAVADGSDQVLLTDPDAGFDVEAERTTGLLAPPWRVTSERLPGVAGARLRNILADIRPITLGLKVEAAAVADFTARVRRLIRATSPGRGVGRLIVGRNDGSSRWIPCHYTEGLEGDEGSSETPLPGESWMPEARFLALDPYFHGEPVTETWSLAPTGIGWFPPIPIRLAPAGVGGRRTLHNPGDTEVPVVIRVQGPGQALAAVNQTIGKGVHLDYVVPSSGPASLITLDTRPGAQTVKDGVNRNLFEHLTDDDPSMWTLLPGDNDILVQLTSTTGSTSVSATFEPLHETA